MNDPDHTKRESFILNLKGQVVSHKLVRHGHVFIRTIVFFWLAYNAIDVMMTTLSLHLMDVPIFPCCKWWLEGICYVVVAKGVCSWRTFGYVCHEWHASCLNVWQCKKIMIATFHQNLKRASCNQKQLEHYSPWSHITEKIKELMKGTEGKSSTAKLQNWLGWLPQAGVIYSI